MWYSALSRFHCVCLFGVVVISLLITPTAGSQTQASCSFKLFLLNLADPNNPVGYVQGANDWEQWWA